MIQQARLVKDSPSAPFEKKKTGLLDRVQNSSPYDVMLSAFKNFLAVTGYERGGILYPTEEGSSALLLCAGMDLTTAHRFSPDIPSILDPSSARAWREFSGSDLEVLTSCFSSRELDSLVSVSAYPVRVREGTDALIVLADSRLDASREKASLALKTDDTERLAETVLESRPLLTCLSRVNRVKLTYESIRDRIRCSLESGKKANLVTVSLARAFDSPESIATDAEKLELFTAFAQQIGRQAGTSNIVRTTSSFSIAVVIFSSGPLDVDLYFHQIIKPLESLFGVRRVSGITVENAGSSTEAGAIGGYLFREA